jgi:heat shock protein HslJ
VRWLLPVVLAASFSGTSWHVTRIGHQPVGQYGLDVKFHNARDISGFDGCNHFGARYRVDGTRLRFRRLFSTAIGCEALPYPSLTERLMRTRRYKREGRRLELRRSGKTLLVLKLRR